MQKWLYLNYSFVCIQNSLTNLAWDNKFFTLYGLRNEFSEANFVTNKRIIERQPLLHRVYNVTKFEEASQTSSVLGQKLCAPRCISCAIVSQGLQHYSGFPDVNTENQSFHLYPFECILLIMPN